MTTVLHLSGKIKVKDKAAQFPHSSEHAPPSDVRVRIIAKFLCKIHFVLLVWVRVHSTWGDLEEFVWIQYVLHRDDSASNFYIEDSSHASFKGP